MPSASLAPRRLAGAVAAVLLSVPALTACSGGGDEVTDDQTPDEVLAAAAETLTTTSGVELDLTTDNLPPGVTGIVQATGTAITEAPAFEGTISVVLTGNTFEVPVVAVDDIVYAQIPLAPGWNEVDPQQYGAPDPSSLIDGETGFPALLTKTEGAEKGSSVRGGANNDEILTTYSGTVPGADMKQVIPSSTGDSFDVEWQVTDDGELRQADLTGVFYPDSEEMTYTVTFDDYGTEKEITAP